MARSGTKFRLNTGAEIPAIGLGTWQDVEAQEEAVLTALTLGYRHIDTAAIYGTEAAIGRAIKRSGIPRDELFITSKLWNTMHHPNDVEEALDTSLSNLGTEYVNLYLMHWPVAFPRGDNSFPKDEDGNPKTEDIDYLDTYRAMEEMQRKGKTRAIGVSNFSKAEIERLLKEATITPAVHQLELHPWLQQRNFVTYLESKGIHISQYSPLGNQNEFYRSGGSKSQRLLDDPVLLQIGKKYFKTSAQVSIAWGIAQGHSVLVKSKTPQRIEQIFQSDFQLSDEDMAAIASLNKDLRFSDSSKDFGYNFFSDLDDKQR